MVILFVLDGTLANCEHRRHFVDPNKNPDVVHGIPPNERTGGVMIMRDYHKTTGELWKPDWKSFYEACDQDEPIGPVINILSDFIDDEYHSTEVQVWSGRCESVREKTETWLKKYTSFGRMNCKVLKMRPIGDSTPDDELKMRWLDDHIAKGCEEIYFVFDDRPKVIRAWRKRGIFVFNCCQHDEEF